MSASTIQVVVGCAVEVRHEVGEPVPWLLWMSALQRVVGWIPVGGVWLLVGDRRCLPAAVAPSLGEAWGALGVVSVLVEVVVGEVPVGALAGAGRLDVGGLFAGLPAAGENDGALDGRALLAVDVLGVGELQGVEVFGGERDAAV